MKHQEQNPSSNTPNNNNNTNSYQNQNNDPPLFRFQATKLRSWLIGYPRILSLHRNHLSTIDPDTFEVTNTFAYNTIRQWKALPTKENANSNTATSIKDRESDLSQRQTSAISSNNTINTSTALIEILEKDGSATKLKFKLIERSRFLTELSNLMHDYETKRKSSHSRSHAQRSVIPASLKNYPSFKALRQLRSGKTVECVLMVNPTALCEWSDANTGFIRVVKEYKFMHIDSLSITSNDSTGLILYHGSGSPHDISNSSPSGQRQPAKARLFFIQGNRTARTDLIHYLKVGFEKLGAPYVLSESITLEDVVERHSQYGLVSQTSSSSTKNSSQNHLGEIASTNRVTKISSRHPEAAEGVQRLLHVTRNGILIEQDVSSSSPARTPKSKSSLGKVVSYWDLKNLHSIIRVEDSYAILKLEFINGDSKLYSSSDRDALAVTIYDACISLANNNTVTITETESDGFRYIPRSIQSFEQKNSKGLRRVAGSPNFGSLTVEGAQVRKLVTYIQEIISDFPTITEKVSPSNSISILKDSFQDIVSAAKEFNANVSIEGITNDVDKKLINLAISSSFQLINQLLTFTATLKQSNHPNTVKETNVSEKICSIILQSLYRILHSSHGFQIAVESTYTTKCFESPSSLLEMNNNFASYWAVRVLSLLINCPYQPRNREQEYVNKQVLLNRANVFKNLVNLLVYASGNVSDWELGEKKIDDRNYHQSEASSLLLMTVSETIESILCTSHDTTAPGQFQGLASGLCDK